ncbi:MAG: methyltransferase domain-containing protein [Nitrospirae bacterium]|nr:methyltransferase domain-containing protein [Nitrospirota bacterium]
MVVDMRWDAEKYDATKAPQIDAGKELIAMAKIRDSDSILDIGCGTGKLTIELANLAAKGFVVGIDPSEEMLEKARRVSNQVKNISFIQIPAQLMDFNERFDLAFSNSALQWVKEQQQVMESVYRSLKHGGRIAFQLPADNFCKEFLNYTENAIAILNYKKFFADWKSPWYFPTDEEYEGKLKAAGFKNINIFYKDYSLVFENINEVLDWWASAGLRPYLSVLPEKEQESFKNAFVIGFENNRTDRGIEFGFRRLFAFAEKL